MVCFIFHTDGPGDFPVQPGHTCPTIVNSDNWLSGETYPDTFAVTRVGDTISVVRTDTSGTAEGWSVDLQFECCPQGETCFVCHCLDVNFSV